MAGKGTITFDDMRGRPTSMTINVGDLVGDFDNVDSALGTLEAAVAALSLSEQHSRTLSGITETGTPDDRGGLRGTKAIVRWFSSAEGDGGQYGSNEIGTVDPSLFTVVGDQAFLQGTLYNNLKAAFDAVAQTENGNAVAVYEVELVSRNI